MTKVALVILHFINKELTNQCLESIKKLNIKGLELRIIVVNNNPQENLKDLEKKFEEFDFINTGKNLGFSEGNNLGIRRALQNKADWVFLVNNDTILDKDLVVRLIEVAEAEAEGKAGIISPKIYFAPGYEFHKNRYKENERGKVIWYAGGIIDWKNVIGKHKGVNEVDKGQYEKIEETDFVSGCAMLIKKEVFEKIGFLDKDYFLYYEDNDFCQRARQAGFKIFYVPKAVVWHKNAGSSRVGSSLHDYYISRNRLLFGMRWALLRSKLALLRESFRILLTGRKWQKRGVVDFYLRKLGKGSYD